MVDFENMPNGQRLMRALEQIEQAMANGGIGTMPEGDEAVNKLASENSKLKSERQEIGKQVNRLIAKIERALQ